MWNKLSRKNTSTVETMKSKEITTDGAISPDY